MDLAELLSRVIDAPQKSEEWLRRRHSIITSSEVASALECNGHESSIELLKRKCSPVVLLDATTSTSINWGEKYEPIAKKFFTKLKSQEVTDIGLVIHKNIPWLGASPDGLLPDGKLLEIKCPFHRNIVSGRIPYYYWIQVQVQLEVCDLSSCYFLQCQFEENPLNATSSPDAHERFTGEHPDGKQWYLKKYTLDVINRDPEWFTKMLPTLIAFWNKIEHYRLHGLNKLSADLGNKQVYYNLSTGNVELFNKSPGGVITSSLTRSTSASADPPILLLDVQPPAVASRGDNVDGNSSSSSTGTLSDAIFNYVAPTEDPDEVPVMTLLRRKRSAEISAQVLKSNVDSTDLTSHQDWTEWVAATAVKNYLMGDPVIDWLEEYGKGSKKVKIANKVYSDHIANYETENKNSSVFSNFLQTHGHKFEDAVIANITAKFPGQVVQIANPYQARQQEKVDETIAAITSGTPVIYQAVFHNESNKTYGMPDMLIRSDYLSKIFKEPPVTPEEASVGCKFNKNWHYVVVDIKHITLELRSDGRHLLNSGHIMAYKGQLYIYNLALSKIQEYLPSMAFILGRKWNYHSHGTVSNGTGWFDRAAVVSFTTNDIAVCAKTENALDWVRTLRKNGAEWTLDPPTKPELYPNMCNDNDAPWRPVKKAIADSIGEITSLYYAGVQNRHIAFQAGITSWRDPKCTAASIGIKGPTVSAIVDRILDVNRGDKVISYGHRSYIIPDKKVSFFVDFETLYDLVETGNYKEAQGNDNSYIFMIGIGWTVKGEDAWNYRCLSADVIDAANERDIFNEMHEIIFEVLAEHNTKNFTIFHWSHAERTFYNKAAEKYDIDLLKNGSVLDWNWFDLYNLFRSVPICVKGALDFSLKSIAKAMAKHELIETEYSSDGILDGLNAMVKAAECSEEAKKRGISMKTIPVMQHIIDYNEIDCKVMMEILSVIRN